MKFLQVVNDEQLALAETLMPTIQADECLIKVRAIGINRADLLQKSGKYPPPKGESDILGLEVSGEIIECGSQCELWHVGDKVFGLVSGGGYAEYVVIKQGQLFVLPPSFTYEQGAATAEVFLTAFQTLCQIAKLQPKSSVLIHAGASGVGTAAIQLAKAINCFVVATVSHPLKKEACLALGANEVIDYKTTDFVAWSKENHPQGFDVILDVVAGSQLNKNINVAKIDAHIVVIAMLGGRFSDPIDFAKMLSKRINISASTLRNRSHTYKNDLVLSFKTLFENALITGDIRPVIHQVFAWHEVNAAHQLMAENKNIGKLVLKVE